MIARNAGLALVGLLLARAVAAQEPPCAAIPEPGRSCVDIVLVAPSPGGLGRTGQGGFGADSEPGNDASATNHVIRTLDLLIYELRWRVLHQSANAARIRLSLPAGLDFADPPNSSFAGAPIPSFCLAGSSIVGQVLSCELGNVADGTARNVAVLTRPRFTLADGSVLRASTEISASNQQTTGAVLRSGYQDASTEADLSCSETRLGNPVTLLPCGDFVSAAPRFDLEFSGYASTNLLDRGARGPQINTRALSTSFTTVVGGAAGRRGYTLAFPVAIALPGDGVGGAPVSGVAPITLTQRLRNSDGIAGFGELVGCGINGNSDAIPNGTLMPAGWTVGNTVATVLRAVFHPFGRIGLGGSTAQNAVVDSGTLSCTQSAAGGDITLSITPAANTFSPPSFPTHQVDGQVVPRKYVFVAMVVVFYPADPVLTPADGGSGDGSVAVRHDLGVLTQGNLAALSINGSAEPDAAAINDGFGAVQSYDDDNNNFSLATLDAGGTVYQKIWRNPRLDTAAQAGAFCLKDASDPACRHGYAFPGANIQSEFQYNNDAFTPRSNAQFCDEWDSTRTRLRRPFDALANPDEMPPGGALYLDLNGLNTGSGVLNGAGFSVEVSTDAGTIANIDWDTAEPARTNARSQISAPECSSGNWVAASLPASLSIGRQLIQLPPALESPPGSGQYPAIKRVRIRAVQLPAFISLALRGSYEVLAAAPGTRLPNRTSFRFGSDSVWTYAENDHAIVRSVDTSINMAATANLSNGTTGPLSSIGFGDVVEWTLATRFTSGEVNPPPSIFPLIVKAYLPATLDYLGGSASTPLFVPPYPGTNPETGQAATVLEWRLTGLRPGEAVTEIRYHAQLNFSAANNSNIHSVATVEHALDPSPLYFPPVFASAEDRLAISDLTAVVPVGLLVSKLTTTPFMEVGAHSRWELRYANTSGAPFGSIRVIDVLPYNGDPVNSANAFSGGYSGGSLAPLLPGEYTLYASSSAVTTINRNPTCVSNGGSVPDGGGACPASGALWMPIATGALPAGTTAIRVDDANGLAANSQQSIELQLFHSGNLAGDVYENSYTAVAPGESLVLASAKAQVRVPAGEITGTVYADLDNSATPTAADLGIGDVIITLTGIDNQGNSLEIVTATISSFSAASTNNTLRINGGAAQTIVCTPAIGLRRGDYLFCRLPSANAAGYRIAETQPPDYLDRADNLGTLASGASAGSVSNDLFSGIALTNNLTTGAGDRGRDYSFGEYPTSASISGRVYREGTIPPNQFDDDDDEDPGIVTPVSLQCVPAYTGNASQLPGPDGRYQFAQVQVGSVCTVRETQPAGYHNAYNTRGPGATGDTGSSGSGDSSISLTLPAAGSPGNNFAELLMTDTTSSISCSPSQPQPGAPVSCTAICSNHGPTQALSMSCNVLDTPTLPNAHLTGCATEVAIAVGSTTSCRVDFNLPASGYVVVNAGSGALNDINGGTQPTQGNNPSAAAVGVLPGVIVPVPLSPQLTLLLALTILALAGWRPGAGDAGKR